MPARKKGRGQMGQMGGTQGGGGQQKQRGK